MTISLQIPEEEMGRFLLAYYRRVFGPLRLGAAFLFYYGLSGFDNIKHEHDDEKALDLIKDEFVH